MLLGAVVDEHGDDEHGDVGDDHHGHQPRRPLLLRLRLVRVRRRHPALAAGLVRRIASSHCRSAAAAVGGEAGLRSGRSGVGGVF